MTGVWPRFCIARCDPNANLYAQPKRDVLNCVPQTTAVEYVLDDIEVQQLRTMFGPDCLDLPTGPDSSEMTAKWHQQNSHD